jgi:hypothetical protein
MKRVHLAMRTRLSVLFYRLRLALRAEGLDLRVADSRKQKLWGVGQYFVVSGKTVVNKNVDLETLAREMGLFESWEAGGLWRRGLPHRSRSPRR